MSEENVGVVRRLYEAQDGPELDSVAKEILDPDIEWHASEAFGVLHGRDAVLKLLEDFKDVFADWQAVAEELIDAGDEVISVNRQRGSGKVSGASMDASYAIAFTIQADKIVRAREYPNRAEALKATGLEA